MESQTEELTRKKKKTEAQDQLPHEGNIIKESFLWPPSSYQIINHIILEYSNFGLCCSSSFFFLEALILTMINSVVPRLEIVRHMPRTLKNI